MINNYNIEDVSTTKWKRELIQQTSIVVTGEWLLAAINQCLYEKWFDVVINCATLGGVVLLSDEMLHEGIASISQLGTEKFPELRAILSTV